MSGFYIDVYSGAGVKENGNSVNITNVRQTERVSRVGDITFDLPALEAVTAVMQYGKQYKVYHEALGLLGTFYHRNIRIDAVKLTATVVAEDSLRQLLTRSVGLNLFYGQGSRIRGTISDLVSRFNTALGVSWGVSFEAGFPNDYIVLDLQGETYLQALDAVRSATRGFFRRVDDTNILFGRFYNVGLTYNLYGGSNLYGAHKYSYDTGAYDPSQIGATALNVPLVTNQSEGRTEYALIQGDLTQLLEGANLVNKVIPVGAGKGQTQLNLKRATFSSPYTIHSDETFPDGSTKYYLRDDTSIALYGETIERVLPFTSIRPITNSDADVQAAANMLYITAASYLRNFSATQEVYSLKCLGLPAAAKVGTVVIVDFRGVVTTPGGAQSYLTLSNRPFYVIEKQTDYGLSGNPVYTLVISTNGEDAAGVQQVIQSVLKDIQLFKVQPDPTQTFLSIPSPTLPITNGRTVNFNFTIKTNVLYLHEMKLIFTLMPLRSYAASALSGGGSVSGGGGGAAVGAATDDNSASHRHALFVSSGTSGEAVKFDGYGLHTQDPQGSQIVVGEYGGGMHHHGVSVNVPSHSHSTPDHTHSLNFGISDDTQTPQGVYITLDGQLMTGITAINGGSVNGASNEFANGSGVYSVDLLQSGGLAQVGIAASHSIIFTCSSQQGQVFAFIDGRVSIQSIQV